MTDKKPTPKRKRGASLSISGIDPAVKKEFAQLSIIANMTQAEFTRILLSNYKHLNVEFDQVEQERLDTALEKSPVLLKRKIKKSILRHIDAIINSPSEETDKADISIKTSPRSADSRADSLLDQILKHNETASNWYDKIFITKSSIQVYAKEQRKLGNDSLMPGKAVLDRCLERHKEAIEAHHRDQGLGSSHNNKAYYARLKFDSANDNKTKV
jgi:hypothetical protein